MFLIKEQLPSYSIPTASGLLGASPSLLTQACLALDLEISAVLIALAAVSSAPELARWSAQFAQEYKGKQL